VIGNLANRDVYQAMFPTIMPWPMTRSQKLVPNIRIPKQGKKDGYVFRLGIVSLGYYCYDESLEILKLERLCRDYIARNPTPKEDGKDKPAFLSFSSLPNLAGSISPDNEINLCGPRGLNIFVTKMNIDKGAVFIKEGAPGLAHQSGISISKEDIDKNILCCIFNSCLPIVLMLSLPIMP
jgi:hypothetical protein